MNFKINFFILFINLFLCIQYVIAKDKKIEASGIVRVGTNLIIVGDDDDGYYQQYSIGDLQRDKILKIKKSSNLNKLFDLDFEYDLEDVDYINGQVLVVSERLGALLSKNKVIASYDKPFAGFGNRGIEGLAIKKTENKDKFKVAALWEGGYPEIDDIPLSMKTMNVLDALSPVILLHSINLGKDGFKKVKKKNISAVPLNLSIAHKWIDRKYPKRDHEPWAYRFRAPGLIWSDDELIVLMSATSEYGKDKYKSKVLQKFNQEGIPTSPVYELDELLEKIDSGLSKKNWEGIAWFDQEKNQIVLVCDDRDATIVLLTLPSNW